MGREEKREKDGEKGMEEEERKTEQREEEEQRRGEEMKWDCIFVIFFSALLFSPITFGSIIPAFVERVSS